MQLSHQGPLAAHYFLPTLDMFTLHHNGQQQVEITTSRYVDDDQLYVALEEHDGGLYADLSVCLQNVPLAHDEFVFKTYSGNEGLLPAMKATGRIQVVRTIDHPMGRLPVCRLA